jgi:C-terminal processing protease CtpA/Prc
MSRISIACAAALLLPLAAQPALAQAGASVTSNVRSAAPTATRASSFTGLTISFNVAVGADGVPVMDLPYVRAVAPGSPGEQVGIRQGDVIIEVNGRDSREDRALWLEAGVRYTLRLRTGDQEREVVLVPLAERPAAAAPAT